jgi:tetratricopeptide (TPR) repeat protein
MKFCAACAVRRAKSRVSVISRTLRRLVPVLPAILLAACSNKIPDAALTQYMQGEDFYVRGQIEAALAVFTHVAKQTPRFYQASFMEGKSLYLLGRPREAQAVLQELVRKEPRYNEAQIWLARIEIQQGDPAAAEKRIAALLSFDSQDERLLYLMALVKSDQGKLQDAISYLQRAGDAEEELARVHIELGRLYYRFALDDKARTELGRAALLLPTDSSLQGPVRDLLTRIDRKE